MKKKNIEFFKGTLILENQKINIPMPLTDIQLHLVRAVLGLEVSELDGREYEVRSFNDNALLDFINDIMIGEQYDE